jgi:hypothetical protein
MTYSKTYVIPFKSRGRLFVEIPELLERNGQIVAGEPLQFELIGEDIVYHKTVGGDALTEMTGRACQQSHSKRHHFWSAD